MEGEAERLFGCLAGDGARLYGWARPFPFDVAPPRNGELRSTNPYGVVSMDMRATRELISMTNVVLPVLNPRKQTNCEEEFEKKDN